MQGYIKKIPALFFRAIEVLSIFQSFNWPSWLLAFLNAAGVLMLAIVDKTPLWAWPLLFLATGTLTLTFLRAFDNWRKSRLITKEDLRRIGDEMIELSHSAQKAITNYMESEASIVFKKNMGIAPSSTMLNPRDAWQEANIRADLSARLFIDIHGSRIKLLYYKLGLFDVKIPFHIQHVKSISDLTGVANFMYVVGSLIKDGNLAQAQAITIEDTWPMMR
ncbi:MAG: hypothetical protein IOC58_00910 [Methylobacterium sp.]|nr:hypothetical protein [Methylobacterium sp.]